MKLNRFGDVDREIKAGRLWRAKQMLQGALANPGFDPELLEKYGQVLLAMGDTLEAGRYLFASGCRQPDYQASIALFVSHHEPKGGDIAHLMPAMIRRHINLAGATLASSEFVDVGYPQSLLAQLAEMERKTKPVPSPDGWQEDLTRIVIVAIILILLVCMIVGFFTIAWWLYGLAHG